MRLLFTTLFLTLLAYAAYLGFRWAGAEYALLASDEQPRMVLIAALALGCTLVLAGAIRYAAREQAQKELLKHRYYLYIHILNGLQEAETPDAQRIEISSGLALLGSRNVLRAFRRLLEGAAAKGSEPDGTGKYLNDLVTAMRTDLQQSNFDIGPELNTFLKSGD
ncbi:MAG: hypothetical protein IPH12_14095 [Saprospirales bacterium]|nr:hypothetical protein [Saprospirales bacterium]MBK8924092.1 hypothetical protein [Saprospirales bacterium]